MQLCSIAQACVDRSIISSRRWYLSNTSPSGVRIDSDTFSHLLDLTQQMRTDHYDTKRRWLGSDDNVTSGWSALLIVTALHDCTRLHPCMPYCRLHRYQRFLSYPERFPLPHIPLPLPILLLSFFIELLTLRSTLLAHFFRRRGLLK